MPRKLVLALAGLVAVLVVALAAIVLLLQTGPVSNRVKDAVVPKVSAALGRQVTVEAARLRVLPSPRVRLAGTTIAGRPGEPPLARIASLDVEVGLWPLVRSLGKELRVDGFTLVRPELNLVRARDGTWNTDGLGGASKGGAPATPPAQGGQPAERVHVARARIQDGAIRVVDRSQGRDDAAVALTRIDLDASGGLGEKLEARLAAALAASEQNVQLSISSPRLPARLGPGSYPQLTGAVALRGLELQKLRGLLPASLAEAFTGGRVDCEAKLASEPGAVAYRLEGDGKLSELRMRGEPASGSFALRGRADPAAGTARLELTKLAVKGPGVDLGGTATLDTKPVRARFAIQGPLLDLGAVLGMLPAQQGAPAPSRPAGALLPPALAREVAQVDVRGTVAIAKVVDGKLTASDVRATAVLRDGVLVLDDATAGLYGGKVTAAGTRVALAEPTPRWNLKARLDAVDLAQAFQAIAGTAPLQGKATGNLDLAGAGASWDQVKKVVTGLGALALHDGALTTTDLGGTALAAISQGLSTIGKGGAAKQVAGLEHGKTTLQDLAASFTVKDGFLTLSRPLTFSTPAGDVRLGGKIGLSQELALDGGLRLSKDALARTGLPAAVAGLELPLRIGGTLERPAPTVDASRALSGAAAGLVAEKKKALQQDVQRQARKGAQDLLHRLGR